MGPRSLPNSQNGFTMVEVLVALGVLVVLFLVGATAINVSQKMTVAAHTSFEMTGLNTQALASLTQVVRDTGPGVNEGLCRFMKTTAITGGIGRIELDFGDPNGTSLSPDWARAFPAAQWEPSTSCTQSNFKRCYKPTERLGGAGDVVLSRNPDVLAEIIPVRARSLPGEGFTPLPIQTGSLSSGINARDVSLLLQLTTSYDDKAQGIRRSEKNFSVIWAGEFSCYYTASNGTRIFLNPSGIGSGVTDQTLFSDVLEQVDSATDLLAVNWEKLVSMGRTVDQDTGLVIRRSDSQKIIMCTERVYRCPDETSARDWYEEGHVKGYVRYNTKNTRIQSSLLRASPVMCLKTGTSAATACMRSKFELSDKAADLQNPEVVYDGSRRGLVIDPLDMKSSGFCPTACESNIHPLIKNNVITDPDYGAELSPRLARLIIRHSFPQIPGYTEDDAASEPVGCACCFTKQCLRFGVTYGSCHEQPTEPMDSRVPECAMKVTGRLVNYSTLNWNQGLSEPLTPASGSEQCVAAQVTGSGDSMSLTLSAEPCLSNLPVLCYQMGRFELARNYQRVIQRGNFNEAPQLCYDLSHEILQDVTSFEDMLQKAQGTAYLGVPRPPVTSNNYDFKNHSLAGLFIAPQTPSQLATLQRIEGLNGKVWVGFRRDERGYVSAAPPLAAENQGQFLVYYDGPLTRFATRSGLNFSMNNPTALVLAHSRDNYGLFPVNSNQPGSTQLPAICIRNDGNLFITAGQVSSLTEAHDLCETEGGSFLPPMTPMHWMLAMHLIAPVSPTHPWPNPTGQSRIAAWVGFRLKNAGDNPYRITSWQIYQDYDIGDRGRVNLRGQNQDDESADRFACLAPSGNLNSLEFDSPGGGCDNDREPILEFGLSELTKYYLKLESKREYGNSNRVLQLKANPPPTPTPTPTPSPSPSPSPTPSPSPSP